MQRLVEEFLQKCPGYIKKSPDKVAYKIGIEPSYENLNAIKQVMSGIRKHGFGSIEMNITHEESKFKKEFKKQSILAFIESSLASEDYKEAIKILEAFDKHQTPKSKVLVIGDIHEPFCLDGYLEFCKEQYDKNKCDGVVFIGDIIDQHFSSFHNSDPDGYGAGEELDRAIAKIAEWYKVFPYATVILGNHDRLAYRKAYSGGISSRWLRSYGDVLNTPNWKFEERIVIDNVLYIHGEAGTAKAKAKDIGQSVVQGHLHSQAYVEYVNNNIFGMQIGCGINDNLYAFNYNKAGKESIISCGVVLEGKPKLIKM